METILIVDDSRTVRKQLESMLSAANFQVLQAENGKIALETLNKYKDIKIVFCDVNMPEMSGFELLKALRDLGNKIPFILLSTESSHEFILRAKGLGANGYLVKPAHEENIMMMIKRFATDQKN
ncbi:MAG: response regulator [Oligoflexales bacterium]